MIKGGKKKIGKFAKGPFTEAQEEHVQEEGQIDEVDHEETKMSPCDNIPEELPITSSPIFIVVSIPARPPMTSFASNDLVNDPPSVTSIVAPIVLIHSVHPSPILGFPLKSPNTRVKQCD